LGECPLWNVSSTLPTFSPTACILIFSDVSSFGALQALPSWLRQFGVQNSEGVYVLDTDRRAIMNGGRSYPARPVNRELCAEEQVVFLGKLVGACLFEPVIERVGCK
jgi:hypothetical protein